MFFVWMTSTLAVPAFMRDNYALDDPLYITAFIWVVIFCFAVLCVLNFYWLYLILTQLWKLAFKKK